MTFFSSKYSNKLTHSKALPLAISKNLLLSLDENLDEPVDVDFDTRRPNPVLGANQKLKSGGLELRFETRFEFGEGFTHGHCAKISDLIIARHARQLQCPVTRCRPHRTRNAHR